MDRAAGLKVYGALSFAMLVWGLSFLAIKDVVAVVPVSTLLLLRFTLAVVFLGAVAVVRRHTLRLSRRDLFVMAGLSALSPVGYFLFETYGVMLTQPSHASVIIATIPIAVAIIAFARRQERFSWKKAAGVAVAYGGIVLLIGSSAREQGASLLGDLLVLGAVACAATRTILSKEALERVSPLQLTFYQFFFSLFVFAPLAAFDRSPWTSQVTPLLILEIAFLGILCSAIAYLAMHYALARLSSTQVAVSANLVPLVTLAAETALFGATLGPLKALGTLLTLSGVIATQLARSSSGRAAPVAPRGG